MPPCQLAREFGERHRCVLDSADVTYLTTSTSIGYRDRDGGLVHVETDEAANFLHGYVS
jgi:hypothetical protein